VRYGSIGGLEYEVPQSRLYCLCISVALCSTALQCIFRVIRRSSMTMKAHTYYIIFGRPPIGGKLPPSPLGGATGTHAASNSTYIYLVCRAPVVPGRLRPARVPLSTEISACAETSVARSPPPTLSAAAPASPAERLPHVPSSFGSYSQRHLGRLIKTNMGPGPDLQNILRQSYDYLTIIPKLRSTYDGRLIYKNILRRAQGCS